MKRIYHNYTLWEDYKHGFYNICPKNTREEKIESVIELFNSEDKTFEYMKKITEVWKYSCEHNLSNIYMNRVAYLGQAACCLYNLVPSLITMEAWKRIDLKKRERADLISCKSIKLWEQKQKLKIISKNGKLKDMKMEYQTKLHFN